MIKEETALRYLLAITVAEEARNLTAGARIFASVQRSQCPIAFLRSSGIRKRAA